MPRRISSSRRKSGDAGAICAEVGEEEADMGVVIRYEAKKRHSAVAKL